MPKMRLRSNPDAIIKSLNQKNLNAGDAAKSAGITKFMLSRVISSNKPISYSTAQKLTRFFGDDSVSIVE